MDGKKQQQVSIKGAEEPCDFLFFLSAQKTFCYFTLAFIQHDLKMRIK